MSGARRWLRLARGSTGYALARARGASFPFSATFILTHRCNFRCRYCDIPAAADEEMSADEFRAAIDELADAGLVRASFSGGEVLLRPDALDIMAHARARGLMVSMNTNAFMARPHLDALADVLDLLVVSLDGPEPVHDLVRRRKGSYARVVEVLQGARARGLPTATITVLNRHNLHVVDEVLDLARAHGFFPNTAGRYSHTWPPKSRDLLARESHDQPSRSQRETSAPRFADDSSYPRSSRRARAGFRACRGSPDGSRRSTRSLASLRRASGRFPRPRARRPPPCTCPFLLRSY